MWLLFVVGFSLACLLHLAGFTLLYHVKMKLENQRLILLNMAASECFACFMQTVEWVRVKVVKYTTKEIVGHPYCYVERFWTYSSYIIMKLLMLYLICDRFLNIHLVVKYGVLFHKGTVRKIISSLWLVAGILAIILDISFHCAADAGILILFFALDLMVAISATLTYIYFYFKVRTSTAFRKDNAPAILQSRKKKEQHKFLVPFVMVLAYIVFNCTSTLLFTTMHFSKGLAEVTVQIMHEIAVLSMIIGCIADAVIYTLLQKDVYLVITRITKKSISSIQTRLFKPVGKATAQRGELSLKSSTSTMTTTIDAISQMSD